MSSSSIIMNNEDVPDTKSPEINDNNKENLIGYVLSLPECNTTNLESQTRNKIRQDKTILNIVNLASDFKIYR